MVNIYTIYVHCRKILNLQIVKYCWKSKMMNLFQCLGNCKFMVNIYMYIQLYTAEKYKIYKLMANIFWTFYLFGSWYNLLHSTVTLYEYIEIYEHNLENNLQVRDTNCSLLNAMLMLWRLSHHVLPQGVNFHIFLVGVFRWHFNYPSIHIFHFWEMYI